jgi:hypothetical protein
MWNKRNVADLEASSGFEPDTRAASEEIAETRNNWICYDFKDRRVVVTDYSIQSAWNTSSHFSHLK